MLLCATVLHAQQPDVGYVYPPVIRAGSTVEVQAGGYDFTPDMQFIVHEPGIVLTPLGPPGDFIVPEPPYWFGEKGYSAAFPIPREIGVRITVPTDQPAGPVRWQVANANGSSPTGVFYVSREEELIETRGRDADVQDLPQLPVAVSGRIRKIAEVDRYRVRPALSGPVTLDLMARRLGSNFNATVEVRDSRNMLVADVVDTEGQDVRLTFAATADQSYTINVFDLDYRGNRAFVYRLAIAPEPRIVGNLPAAARPGEIRRVRLFVDTGQSELSMLQQIVAFPASHALPVAEILGQAVLDVPAVVAISTIPEFVESDGRRVLIAPCGVTGLLEKERGVDRYSFHALAGEAWSIQLQSRSLGSRVDVTLDVENEGGEVVASNDDSPGTSDARLDFTAPAAGAYDCVIRGASGLSGARAAVYRLVLSRPQPGFLLTTAQQLSAPIGGQATFAVTARREAGFSGEIALRFEGLPEGVTAPEKPLIPADANEANINLEISAATAAQAKLIRIVGTATIDGKAVEHVVLATAGGNLCPRAPEENQTDQVLITTTMESPVTIAVVDRETSHTVHRGTTFPVAIDIQRTEGYHGDVLLQMASKQSRHRQGIRGPILRVPAGEDHALYPCFMPEWLETDRTSRMNVMVAAEVADPHGNLRWMMSKAKSRVTMILEGALLKIAHEAGELTVRPGESFDVPVEVSRSAKLPLAVTVRVEVPEALREVIHAKPIALAVSELRGTLQVQTKVDPVLDGDWSIRLIASTLQDGRWPVVSQTEFPIRFVGTDASVAKAR